MMNIKSAMGVLETCDIERGWRESPGGWSMTSLHFIASLLGMKPKDIPAAAYGLLGSIDTSLLPAEVWVTVNHQAHTLIVDVSGVWAGHEKPHLIAAAMPGLRRLAFKQYGVMGEVGRDRMELTLAAIGKWKECPSIDLSEHYEVPAALLLMKRQGKLDERVKVLHINGAAVAFVPPSVEVVHLRPHLIDWSALDDAAPALPALRTVIIEANNARLRASELCELSAVFEARSPNYKQLIIRSHGDEMSNELKIVATSYIRARNSDLQVVWSK